MKSLKKNLGAFFVSVFNKKIIINNNFPKNPFPN